MTADPAHMLLGGRIPAQAVIEELLARQSLVRPRTWIQRILGVSPLGPIARPGTRELWARSPSDGSLRVWARTGWYCMPFP